MAGEFRLGEERFDAGDGVWGDGLVRVEQRGDEVGCDGFHWLALLEEFFKIGLGGFPKSTLQRGRGVVPASAGRVLVATPVRPASCHGRRSKVW